MIRRTLLLVITGLSLSACVDSERLRSNLGGPPSAPEVEHRATKQTFASRVLGAMALERVTGRKADPGRLKDLR
jgi:hypothetical protein